MICPTSRIQKRTHSATAAGVLMLLAACGNEGSDLVVERLPDVQTNLPAVPTIPPPPHPLQYQDGTHSVYGVRQRIRNTMDTDVEVTGYIVEIYQPPACEEPPCPVATAPHMWLADTAAEEDAGKRLTVVGYAENQAQIDEAIEDARRGRTQEDLPDGVLPIPTDFAVGAKVKVQGHFTRISGSGFNISDGLLEYRAHTILEAAPGSE